MEKRHALGVVAPILTAPAHLRGRMSKFTPPSLIEERARWARDAGRAGHSSYAVAEALGLTQYAARVIMFRAGWRWWQSPRLSRRWPQTSGGR